MAKTITLSDDEIRLINAALSVFEDSMDYNDDWYAIEQSLLPKIGGTDDDLNY